MTPSKEYEQNILSTMPTGNSENCCDRAEKIVFQFQNFVDYNLSPLKSITQILSTINRQTTKKIAMGV
jgi:hypothetical protein